MKSYFKFIKYTTFILNLYLYKTLAWAAETTGVAGVDDMLIAGQSITKVAARWGGIATVVCAALALGSGRLEGALAQTISKILIVVGLLIAAYSFFGKAISWGFSF